MGDDNGLGIVFMALFFIAGFAIYLVRDAQWEGYAQGWCTHAQGTLIERKCVLKDGQIVEPKP